MNSDDTEKIKALNMLFSTHSPFILSDMPNSNILRLKDGCVDEIKEQTFGANIHELLANDFFMKDGYMGAFAKEKIQEMFNELRQGRKVDFNRINIIGEPFIKESIEFKNKNIHE